MDSAHARVTHVHQVRRLAILGAAKKDAEELVEMCQEATGKRSVRDWGRAERRHTIDLSWDRWQACSSSEERHHRHRGS